MTTLKQRLSPELINALLGLNSAPNYWPLRSQESSADRAKLLDFLDTPSAKSELLDFLRDHHVPRKLANFLLEIAEIPITIPAGAMNVLGLGENCIQNHGLPTGHHAEDGSPLDWPVFWDNPGYGDSWYWRRNDWPIVAVQLNDGSWEREGATY